MLRTPLIRSSASLGKFTSQISRLSSQIEKIAGASLSNCRQPEAEARVPAGRRREAPKHGVAQFAITSTRPNEVKQRLQPVFLTTSRYATNTSTDTSESTDEGTADYGTLTASIDNIYEAESDFGTESDDHLRINLYPDDPDPMISKLLNATTLQEIFDTISSIPVDSRNEKHVSQALISVCNLQKYLYKICIGMDPEKDSENKALFVQKVNEHPTFKEIVGHLVTMCGQLEDEPLAASVLALKRLGFSVMAPECQEMLQVCQRRKTSLALPALSRITVCVRSENCALMVYEFLPSLLRYTESMDSDISVRLVSISVKNIRHNVPQRISHLYRQRLSTLLRSQQIKWEAITLCKALLCLFEISMMEGQESEPEPSTMSLIREVGNLLAARVDELDVLDLIILQKYIEFGPKEPRALLDALNGRTYRLVKDQDDTPVVELLQAVIPSIRSAASRAQVSAFARDHLNQVKDFERVSSTIAKILRYTRLNDAGLFNQYWLKAEELLRRQTNSPSKVVRVAQDYLSFVRANNYSYRSDAFELTAKQILHNYLRNYRALSQPCLIHPFSVSRAFAFIIAFGSPYEPIFCETDDDSLLAMLDSQFAHAFSIVDWMTIGRGIEASMNLRTSKIRSNSQMLDRRRYSRRYLEQLLNFIAILDEKLAAKLEEATPTPTDLYLACKAQLSVKKGSSDSPIFQDALRQLTQCAETRPDLFNSRIYKNIVISLLSTAYNTPELIHHMKEYITRNADSVSPDFVAKFVFLAYSLGFESAEADADLPFFQACYKIINLYWVSFPVLELLQAMQALCFYHALDSELVHNVFSMDFLNQVDEELAVPSVNAGHALKLRIAFMNLNRAVCMELPEAQVPWFHEKFCEDLRAGESTTPSTSTHVNNEVYSTLSDVLSNSDDAIQRDIVTPYSYTIDFLIEFDAKGRPIKKRPKRRSLFSFSKTKTDSNSAAESSNVSERVAILVLTDQAYSKNVRRLRGFARQKVRHLEMLGYRVILVDPQQWNSMYMSEQAVRNDFLEQRIYARERARNG